jgi:glycosyltransferase involved in cell wall biosynthesis
MPFFALLRSVRKRLRQQHPDIIHAHRYKENIIAHLGSRALEPVKLISTQHGIPEHFGGAAGLRHRLIMKYNFHLLSRRFQKIVLVSEDIQKTLINMLGLAEGKLAVIHNGIEIPEGMNEEKHNGNFVVGSCGRFFPVKDYSFFVEVAKASMIHSEHIRFEIAGDGPERSKIQTLIERYKLNGRVRLRGHVDDIAAFYRGLDLYLNTSIHEGIPMSVLEAMAHGVPVLAPKVGGLREIIEDGVDGYLMEDRDPGLFAEKCRLLFNSVEIRTRMAKAARQKVISKFSVINMVSRYHDLYRDAYDKQ